MSSIGGIAPEPADPAPLISPRAIAGLNVWWNANDLSGVNNDAISNWPDRQVGLNFGTTGWSNGGKPRILLANNKRFAHFNGTQAMNVVLDTNFRINFGDGEFTIVVVVRPDQVTDSSNNRILNKGANNTSTGPGGRYALDLPIHVTNSSVRSLAQDGSNSVGQVSASGIYSTQETFALIAVLDRSNDELRTYKNATLLTTSNASALGNIDQTSSPAESFKDLIIGGAPVSTNALTDNYTGAIGEIIMYNRALTDDDRLVLQEYFNAIWSI